MFSRVSVCPRGACMAGGYVVEVCVVEVCVVEVCMAGGRAWLGDAWQGVHVRGWAWWGVGMAGEIATAVGGTHPTGMHSCLKVTYTGRTRTCKQHHLKVFFL